MTGQEPDCGWVPWEAVVASRAALTVAESLGARFHQAVSPRAAARSWGWRCAAIAQAGLDLARGRWLEGDRRFRPLLRWAFDAADLALWCLAADDDWDTSEDAVVPGVALACEAGARQGAAGIWVPAANAALAALIRRRRGHRLRLAQFSWQAMGWAGGWLLTVLGERNRRALEARHRMDRQALRRRAEMAGFHDLIVEHEGAVDLLQRATALIDLASPGGATRGFAGALKAAAADDARGEARYLADVLFGWQAGHNQRPDLASMVDLRLASGAGQLLLSHRQAEGLARQLDGLGLAGPTRVELLSRPGERPFAPLQLRVDGRFVHLAGEVDPPRWVFDATPVAFLLNLGWLAQPTGAHREAVPWRAAIGPMAASLAAALWSARLEAGNRAVPPAFGVGASGVITLAYTAASCKSMRNPHTERGVSRFPWVMALQGFELVRTIPSENPSPLVRRAGLLAGATIVAAGWRASPPPRSARALVAELAWVVSFSGFARRLRQEMAGSARRLSEEIAARDQEEQVAAYRKGRERARRVVEKALTEARAELERRAGELPDDLRGEAARRLDLVGAALASA